MKKTEKYNNMIIAFACDFSIYNEENDITQYEYKMILQNNEKLQKDIQLIAELEYKIRHGMVEIYEKQI